MVSTEYNFSRASRSSDLVYGSVRPGSKGPVVHVPNNTPIEALSDVEQWVAYMKSRGIQKVVNLLSPSENESFEQPISDTMAASFEFVNVDVQTTGFGAAVDAIQSGVADGKKVVVHCWGGSGRTGMALAAWLAKYQPQQFSPAAAAEEVLSAASEVGAKRSVKVEELLAVLQKL